MRNGAPPRPDPSNRWPWLAALLGVLVVAVAVAIFLFNRSNTVNINVGGTPTPNPQASAASPGPPPTLVPPTLSASASLVASPTALPSPTPQPTPSPLPTAPPTPTTAPTPAPAPASPGAQASPAPGAPVSATAGTPAAGAPAATPPTAAGQSTAVAPTATPFSSQVAAGGGLGNTRSDIDAAFGAPAGQTPNNLVVFRKNNFEYHLQFVPDLNGRAALIATSPQNGQPIALDQAQAEAHRLLPRDAQPPNPTPEGNAQFVVERYTSQSLAQPLSLTSPDFMIVYARNAQGSITRWVLGPGDDPNALLQQGSS